MVERDPGDTSLMEYAVPRGSQRWLQLTVNRCPDVIDGAIAKANVLEHGETVQWLSPLEADAFAEYRDHAFLERLGITPQNRRLEDFWPRRGPVWDGLARTSGGRHLLIEAKANIPEFDTTPTGASEGSLQKIRKAFDETRAFLRVRSKTDWSVCFYQYANRLAHLYFLRELNKVDAALIFVYFVGDTTICDMNPVSCEGWQAAIDLANHHLGIRAHSPWMRNNVADVFIDVGDLGHIAWP